MGNEYEFLKSLETSSLTVKESGWLQERVQPSDLAALFPTSGSTGLSKLSAFTQAAVLDIANNWQNLFRLQHDDILFQVPFQVAQDRLSTMTSSFRYLFR